MQTNDETIKLQTIQEIIGTLDRKKRFEAGEKISLEQLVERHDTHEKMCHNCAFREDSPERSDAKDNYPSQYWSILLALHAAAKGTGPYQPFFCHRKMPTCDGGKNFQPELGADGMPLTDKICAGWLAEAKQQIEFQKKLKAEVEVDRKMICENCASPIGERNFALINRKKKQLNFCSAACRAVRRTKAK